MNCQPLSKICGPNQELIDFTENGQTRKRCIPKDSGTNPVCGAFATFDKASGTCTLKDEYKLNATTCGKIVSCPTCPPAGCAAGLYKDDAPGVYAGVAVCADNASTFDLPWQDSDKLNQGIQETVRKEDAPNKSAVATVQDAKLGTLQYNTAGQWWQYFNPQNSAVRTSIKNPDAGNNYGKMTGCLTNDECKNVCDATTGCTGYASEKTHSMCNSQRGKGGRCVLFSSCNKNSENQGPWTGKADLIDKSTNPPTVNWQFHQRTN